MQSKLPDVNHAIVTYRNAMIRAYDQGDYVKAAFAVDAINALLPEDYKLEINDEKYKEIIKEQKIIICDKCKAEHKQNDIKPYKLMLPFIISAIRFKSGDRASYMTYWRCPSCSFERSLEGSQFKEKKLFNPSYLGIVPMMPQSQWRTDRRQVEADRINWLDVVVQEIEHKIGLYRAEYAAQNPDAEMEIVPTE